jgi:hypothetical protein
MAKVEGSNPFIRFTRKPCKLRGSRQGEQASGEAEGRVGTKRGPPLAGLRTFSDRPSLAELGRRTAEETASGQAD